MPRSLMTMVTWCSASGSEVQKSQLFSGAAQVGARVALDRVVEVGELQRVAQEEDRGVVADQVPVAFLGVELQREAADVALGVGRAALAGHGGEAGEHLGLLADLRRRSWPCVYRVMSWVTVKVPKAPEPLACMRRSGMTSRSKWASFSRNQTILQQQRAARAGGHAVLVVGDRRARGGGQRLRVVGPWSAPFGLVRLSIDGLCELCSGLAGWADAPVGDLGFIDEESVSVVYGIKTGGFADRAIDVGDRVPQVRHTTW